MNPVERVTLTLRAAKAPASWHTPGGHPCGAVVILEGVRSHAPHSQPLATQLAERLAAKGVAALVLHTESPPRALTRSAVEEDRDLLALGIAEVERRSGLAASLVGIGVSAVHVVEAAADGRAHAAVVWDMDLEDVRTLETAWHDASASFQLDERSVVARGDMGRVGVPGERDFVRALAERMDGVRARPLPAPLLSIIDHQFRSGIDRIWFDTVTLNHRQLMVSAARDIARPDGGGGWSIEDLILSTVDWLVRQRPRVLADEPRVAGLLAEASAPLPESRGRIFISYKHGDEARPRAESVRSFLQAAGFRVFFDRDSLNSGDLRQIIERAIREDCSAGVLVVTPELARSNFIPDVELPALLANALRQGVALSVDNGINAPNNPELLDAAKPQELLRLPSGTLDGCTQYDLQAATTKHRDGMDVFIQRMLAARLAPLRGRPVYIDIQTYPSLHQDAVENKAADLRVRVELDLRPRADRRPLHDLDRLKLTFPLISAELHAIQPDRIIITGGAHPSVALALGGMLVSTKMQFPVLIEDRHGVWGRDVPDELDPMIHDVEAVPLNLPTADPAARRVAVLVGGTQTIPSLFTTFVSQLEVPIASAVHVRVNGDRWIDSKEGVRIAARIAEEIEAAARTDQGACEILLCHSLGFPLGVMIGQRLNKYSVVCYDVVNDGNDKWYRRVLCLDASDSQVSDVFSEPIEPGVPDRYL